MQQGGIIEKLVFELLMLKVIILVVYIHYVYVYYTITCNACETYKCIGCNEKTNDKMIFSVKSHIATYFDFWTQYSIQYEVFNRSAPFSQIHIVKFFYKCLNTERFSTES